MIINLILLVVMVLAALWTVLARSLLKAMIGLALVSASIAVLMFRLDSSLAGVFELSVCTGLITAIFATTISLMKPLSQAQEKDRAKARLKKYWPLPLLMIAAAVLAWKFLKLPVDATLLTTGMEKVDVRHLLWNVRHMDILGQVVIVLLGAFGVIILFRGSKKT